MQTAKTKLPFFDDEAALWTKRTSFQEGQSHIVQRWGTGQEPSSTKLDSQDAAAEL
jgi:hypothetical protein